MIPLKKKDILSKLGISEERHNNGQTRFRQRIVKGTPGTFISQEDISSLCNAFVPRGGTESIEPMYADKALNCERVPSKLYSRLIDVIINSGVPMYAYQALDNERVSTRFHPKLVNAIVGAKVPMYADKALNNERVSTKFHTQLIGVIIESKVPMYAYQALTNPKVDPKFHEDLKKTILNSGEKFYIQKIEASA